MITLPIPSKTLVQSWKRSKTLSGKVGEINDNLQLLQLILLSAELVPEIEVESVISSSSSSSSSSDSTVGDIEESSELTTVISEPENDGKDNSDTEQADNEEANKDSSCVVVENDQCPPNFDESSDKDNEVVNEPVTQIEALNNDAIDNSVNDECDDIS